LSYKLKSVSNYLEWVQKNHSELKVLIILNKINAVIHWTFVSYKVGISILNRLIFAVPTPKADSNSVAKHLI
jgi:hypothetical protein